VEDRRGGACPARRERGRGKPRPYGLVALVLATVLALGVTGCASGAQQALEKRTAGTPTVAASTGGGGAAAGAGAASAAGGSGAATSAPSAAQASPGAAAGGGSGGGAAGGAGEEKVSGGVAIRLNSAQFLERGNYVSPKDGHVFVALDVTLKNGGQQEVTVGGRAVTLKDAGGTEFRRNLTAGSKPSPGTTIAPGAETRGEWAYEVPASATALTLTIAPAEGAPPAVFEIKKG